VIKIYLVTAQLELLVIRIRSEVMKLSEQLKQDHECGDFGNALEGYSEKAKELEGLLKMCCKDLYSQTGKFKKGTALKLYNYVNDNGIDV
jgi:hypothetical protein